MTATPIDEQLTIAATWLRLNEGDEAEQGACIAVANWLDEFALQDMLRKEARKAGIPVKALRKRLNRP